MEITDIDRLAYGLLFESFLLNPERISMPDIDIDFCTRGRGEIIRYVTEKYGREQVAQIITFGSAGNAPRLRMSAARSTSSTPTSKNSPKLIPTQPLNIKLKDARKAEAPDRRPGEKGSAS